MKHVLFACVAFALVGCGNSAPSTEEAVKDQPESVTHSALAAYMQKPPADFRERPCIYVKKWNVGGTYDANGEHGEGGSFDGGAFAYLGEVNGLVMVAIENHRRRSPGLYPEAKFEPEWVVVHFEKDALTFNEKETLWVLNGNAPITSDACKTKT